MEIVFQANFSYNWKLLRGTGQAVRHGPISQFDRLYYLGSPGDQMAKGSKP
jgi:hypothetical protein